MRSSSLPLAALVLCLLASPAVKGADSQISNALASPEDFSVFATFYYVNPRPEKIAAYLDYIDRGDWARVSKAFGSVVGFMAEQFRLNPDKRAGWLFAKPYSRNTQTALVFGLWMAGAQNEARAAAQKFGWNTEEIASLDLRMKQVPDLADLAPSNGNELDMFWGAFFASGEKRHIDKVLFAYNSHARNPQIDAKDVLLVARTIGSTQPDPSDLAQVKTLKSRYSDQVGYAVIIAATALWALGSNTDKHDRVREIVLNYVRTAYDMPATRALAKYIAMSSTKIVGTLKEKKVMLTTTSDRDFINSQLKGFLETQRPFRVDKVFRKGEPAYVALVAFVPTGDTLEYSADIKSSTNKSMKHEARTFHGSSGTSGRVSIQAALIPVKTRDTDEPGLYEIVVGFQPGNGEPFFYRTLIYVEYD